MTRQKKNALQLACVASVSVWFRSKERGRAKNESKRQYKKWGENSEKKHPYPRNTCNLKALRSNILLKYKSSLFLVIVQKNLQSFLVFGTQTYRATMTSYKYQN